MSTEAKVVTGVTIVTILIIAAGLYFASLNAGAPALGEYNIKSETLVRDYSPKIVGKNSKVEIVEFADYQCPSCAVFNTSIDRLLKERGDEITYVWRTLPIHVYSTDTSVVAYAAAKQGKFMEMSTVLFDNQAKWENPLADRKALFNSYAKEIGLDMEKFSTEIAKSEYRTQVAQDKADAQATGVNATPTIIINGTKVIVGAVSYDKLLAAVDEAINASKIKNLDVSASATYKTVGTSTNN